MHLHSEAVWKSTHQIKGRERPMYGIVFGWTIESVPREREERKIGPPKLACLTMYSSFRSRGEEEEKRLAMVRGGI